MAIKKIASLKGRIDCPDCFSLLEWDSVTDVHVTTGNKYVICPICGKYIDLDPKRDYWIEVTDDGGGSDEGGEGQNPAIVGQAVVGTAVTGQDSTGG